MAGRNQLSAMLIQDGHKLRAVWREVNPAEESERSFNSKENSCIQAENSQDSRGKTALQARVDARFEALYRDNEFRKVRSQRLVEEKEKMEQRILRQKQSSMQPDLPFDKPTFEKRYQNAINQRKRSEQIRQAMKSRQDAERAKAELKECTFKPAVSSGSRIQKKTEAKINGITAEYRKITAEQNQFVEELKQMESEEAQVEADMQVQCEAELEGMMKENEEQVGRYLETEEGLRAFNERVVAYCDSNPEISMSRARTEARNDYVQVNEATCKQEIVDRFAEKRHIVRQRMQIRRLAIVHELTKLETAHKRIKPTASSRSQLRGFDVHLVATLKQEPWYIVAKQA